MKAKNLILLAILLIMIIPARSQQLVKPTADQAETELSIVVSEPERVLFSFRSAPVFYTNVKSQLGDFVRLSVSGFGKSNVIGSPELPVFSRLIEIPQGAEVVSTINSQKVVRFNLSDLGVFAPVVPLQPSQPKSGTQFPEEINKTVYQSNTFFSEPLVSVQILGTLRGARIARLSVSPFQYNPVTGEVICAQQIDFELVFENADLQATAELKSKTQSPYFTGVYNRLLNNQYNPASRDEITSCPVVYVIISDPMFKGQLDPFIAWKRRKGFTVIEAYTDVIGATKPAIKAFIQDLYDNPTPEQPAPSFVLFVGDIGEIPAYDNGSGVTDRNYVEYTGDLFPEIYYGRFSAQNATHLQPFIDKSLMVEQYTMPNPTYLDTVVMVAGMDAGYGASHGNGQINYGTINYFNEDHGIFSHTYLYPASGSNAANMRQNISDGVSFANYTAHCSPSGWADPSFSQSDIPNLANTNQYGLLIGNCCSSSEYQTSCFGEDIVRAPGKGAVGYIGASNSTYWDEDYYFGVGLGTISENPPSYYETGLGNYDRAFHDHGEPQTDWYTTMAQHIFAGNMAVSESNSSRKEYYWDIYNLMGDPSLMIYYSVPDDMPVVHEQFIMIGSEEFLVETAPYAYLALNYNGALKATALADENGMATLLFDPISSPGWAELVITAQNFKPLIENIQVFAPNGPYCIYEAHEVSDDSLGNNNHHADYNEQAFLTVTMNNYGNEVANGVRASISTANDHVAILNGTAYYGEMPINQSTVVEKGFLIQLSDNVPDQQELLFTLTATDNQDSSWQSEFSVIAYAPNMNPGQMIVLDAVGGNGNGRLDPGEIATLKFVTTNTGHAVINNVTASLVAYNPFITVLSGDTVLPSITTFGACYPQFEVQVAEDVPDGIFGEMHLTLQGAGYVVMKAYYPRIGLLVEDWETGNFNQFDWYSDGDLPWTINNQYPYQGYYDVKSGSIGDNQTTEFYITYQVMSNDSISFYKKVSSEPDFDKLKFYIDNTLKNSWSGTTQGWTREVFPVSSGVHTFRWSYEKDFSGQGGSDRAWIDYIGLPTMMATTVFAGPDDVTCEGNDFQCMGSATNFVSLQWLTTGSGTFDLPEVLNPVYVPSEEDLQVGHVNLCLALIDVDGQPASDTMQLRFDYTPEAPFKPEGPEQVDLQVTTQSDYEVIPVSGLTAYSWEIYPPEAGTISGTSTTGTANWNNQFEGSAWIKVAGVNGCGIGAFSDSLEVILANPVGLSPADDVISVSVIPNPNNGEFYLKMNSGAQHTVRVSVTNSYGQRIIPDATYDFAGNFQKSYSLNGLPHGIVYVRVQSNSFNVVKKVLIK